MAQGAADAAGGVASSRCNTIYEHSDGAASDHPSLRGRALYLKGHPRNASNRKILGRTHQSHIETEIDTGD
jgi:hypothetical protein